eukprot:CAMPEP_0172496214 /NCGR_PEP_ID=MMETSP1066-20121228/83495_1 /TAXON_ID=671091 /ORGANISM="Coscinodiscus wailesii, Strain CCMP2513" /LENGTH=61 /DNA_ID=CAMNT_0013268393 /DNA_START=85 /DNA_END=266 /DNA_ORIENTATION=-
MQSGLPPSISGYAAGFELMFDTKFSPCFKLEVKGRTGQSANIGTLSLSIGITFIFNAFVLL